MSKQSETSKSLVACITRNIYGLAFTQAAKLLNRTAHALPQLLLNNGPGYPFLPQSIANEILEC
eukprot:3243958-Amphidinium_carterae.2